MRSRIRGSAVFDCLSGSSSRIPPVQYPRADGRDSAQNGNRSHGTEERVRDRVTDASVREAHRRSATEAENHADYNHVTTDILVSHTKYTIITNTE